MEKTAVSLDCEFCGLPTPSHHAQVMVQRLASDAEKPMIKLKVCQSCYWMVSKAICNLMGQTLQKELAMLRHQMADLRI